jgi:outer membrane protein assembly factor BamB
MTVVGTRIGPYKIVQELGAGGMGNVYLATSRSGRAVAVKVVRQALANDPEFRGRFSSEVAAARAVSGAFTAPVVDADLDAPQPWLATAYVPGPSLQSAIDTHGAMPEPSLRLLGSGLAEALVAVHRAGLIHRDLKPSNILLASDGPRVIDFGISRAVDGTALTADGEVIGSAGYMSPEHAAGAALTPASDVFSFGAVLVFAATGKPPFGVGSADALLYRTRHEEPRLDGAPAGVAGIITACLAKNPAARPAPETVIGWLRPGMAGSGDWLGPVQDEVRGLELTVVETVRQPAIRRRRLLVGGGVVAAGAVAAAAGGVWWLASSDKTQKNDPVNPPSTQPKQPTAGWTADLAESDMTVNAAGTSTIVCLDKTGAAAFDRVSGQALWNDAGQDADTLADPTSVYALRSDGQLYGLDARTGAKVWTCAQTDWSGPQLELTASGTVVVATDDAANLHGIGTADGVQRWTFPVGEPSRKSAPGGAGRMILVSEGSTNTGLLGGVHDNHHVLDLASGRQLWSQSLEALCATPDAKSYYAIDMARNVVGLDANGKQRWSSPTKLPDGLDAKLDYAMSLSVVQGVLVCYPGTKIFGADTGVLTVFDATDGRTLWSITTADDEQGYAVSGQTLCCLDQTLRAVDLRTGRHLWTTNASLGTLQLLGVAGGMFLTAGPDGLTGWDPATGTAVWKQAISGGGGGGAAAVQSGNGLYVSSAGKLMAFTV